jgi:FKBP-type peptidyl-prolyl cis-trans isomerase
MKNFTLYSLFSKFLFIGIFISTQQLEVAAASAAASAAAADNDGQDSSATIIKAVNKACTGQQLPRSSPLTLGVIGGSSVCAGTAKSKKGDLIAINVHSGIFYDNCEKLDKSILPEAFVTLGSSSVIPGLNEGLSGMCVGEVRRLIIPSDLAFGEEDGTVIFEIELTSILLSADENKDAEVAQRKIEAAKKKNNWKSNFPQTSAARDDMLRTTNHKDAKVAHRERKLEKGIRDERKRDRKRRMKEEEAVETGAVKLEVEKKARSAAEFKRIKDIRARARKDLEEM